MICHANSWIFAHIQKTGGNAIRTALRVGLDDPHKHRTALELRHLHGEAMWRDSYKFAFVRNPWERLVSWWSMIERLRPRYEAGATFNAFQSYILSQAQTFEEFLTRCDDEIADADGRKHIFRNQADYLTDQTGQIIVDFIGRFERLQEDISKVAAEIGASPLILPRINRSPRRPYSEYYTRDLADLVAERYRQDLRLFHYRFGD